MLLRLVHGLIEQGYDAEAIETRAKENREALLAEARAGFAKQPEDVRALFERRLERCNKVYGIREDDEIFTVSAPMALLRYAVLAAGKRLVAADTIDTPEGERLTLLLPEDQ